MDDVKKKRTLVRRSSEERIKEIDDKIAYHKDCIAKLKKKKESILHPQVRTSKSARFKLIIKRAREAGMTNEEIAQKLGITLDD